MDCLTCGSKAVDPTREHYFVVPGHFMVPNSYLLCNLHKDLRYTFDDIYTPDANRKEIDHDAVIQRALENPPNDEDTIHAIQMSKTSPEFRKGFIFAIKAIHDILKNREGYTTKELSEFLGSIEELSKTGTFWDA